MNEALANPRFGTAVVEDIMKFTTEIVNEKETAPPLFLPSDFLFNLYEKRLLNVEQNGILFCGRTVGR